MKEKTVTFVACNAAIAQLVEHQLPKLRVASSSLVCRSSEGIQSFRRAFTECFSYCLNVLKFRLLGRFCIKTVKCS